MSSTLLLIQLLNGIQLGVLLFLIAAGLTLVFGVALALLVALALSLLLEFAVFRHLYDRDHLDQVLATFGVILFLNQAVKVIWGPTPLVISPPKIFAGTFPLTENLNYDIWRIAIIVIGLGVAGLLWLLVSKTRIGMLVRAGASNAEMVGALGVNIRRLFMIVFGFGAMLAGFAGAIAAPIYSVEPGMGDGLLITAFVVIVIGGIGSIRGAFIAALLVGLVDTLGRSTITDILKLFLEPSAANQIGPALASMAIYILMAAVLFFRPEGLFPAQGRRA